MKKNTLLKAIQKDVLHYISFSAVFVLIIVFASLQPSFIGITNIKNLLSDTAPLLIMASGMTFVILLGSIDLSVGAVCSVANVLFVQLLMGFNKSIDHMGMVMLLSVLLVVTFGGLSGFMLGIIHEKLKIPSFIASLGMMSVWKSAALLICAAPIAVAKVLWSATDWYKINYFNIIGLPLIMAVLLIALFYLVQSRTVFGRSLYALGGNERAARIAGIPVSRAKIMAFTVNGICSALGGIFLAAKLKSGVPTVGDSYTLIVIAAVVLGGASLLGGKGSVAGTVIGVFIVAIIRNGMNFVGVDVFYQSIVFGVIILLAVALSVDRSIRNLIIK